MFECLKKQAIKTDFKHHTLEGKSESIAVYYSTPVFRILIRIGSALDWFPGSGSKRCKISQN
jgi:hypothetical protein